MTPLEPDRQRLEVWTLLSAFWTDNEAQLDDLVSLAQRLAASPYSVDELEHIYAREVAPAFAGVVVAGALSGGMAVTAFDYSEAEVEERLRRWLHPGAVSRWSPLRLLAARYGARWARRDWDRVLHHVRSLRDQGPA